MADEWVRNSEQMSSSQEFMLKYLQILMCWSIKCLKCLTILNKHNFTKWLYYDFHDFKTLIMRVRARRERKKRNVSYFLIKSGVYYSAFRFAYALTRRFFLLFASSLVALRPKDAVRCADIIGWRWWCICIIFIFCLICWSSLLLVFISLFVRWI